LLKLVQLFFSVVRPLTLLKWAIYLIIPATIWVWANFPTIQAYLKARDRRETYQQEVSQLKSLQEQLVSERTELQTGGFQLEKTIREKQFMVYPGEKIIVIQDPGNETQSPESATPQE
jgi:cell division protein FtsB